MSTPIAEQSCCANTQKAHHFNNSSCSAVEGDVSLQFGLHAYRFSLRDFDIGGYLGDGAQGSVFLARERRSGFICVLKCITKAHLIRGGNEALLKKEVELQAHLKHPHICCMYTWFQTTSAIFLVMEYCHEGDLFALLDATEHGFDEATVARYVFQIAWAIRTCHDKRIAHLDIKPENVLVNHKGDLKLADFGLSAHIGGAHRKRGVSIHRGTCDYFSPEQCYARMKFAHRMDRSATSKNDTAATIAKVAETCAVTGFFDEKSDIWMLGVLAFELYFKCPPFGTQCKISEEDMLKNITLTKWDDRINKVAANSQTIRTKLDKMSPEFREFLSACLNKTSTQRPTAESLLQYQFIEMYNAQIKSSLIFLNQPRQLQGHLGFNQPGMPWQTPKCNISHS